MALPRPMWNGYLKLVLVSCPIAIYAATTSTEKVSFNQINRQTGRRIRQKMVDEGTGEPVEAADKVRGYQVDKNVYVLFEDDEIDSVAIETSQTVDMDVFVPRDQIDRRYLDSPYYIAPRDRVGLEAFATIRDAMEKKGLVALGRVVMGKRERVIMLEPWERGLLGTTLRYSYEVRDAAPYFQDIDRIGIGKELVAMAMQIIDQRTADFDPTKFHDRYEEALVELIARKKAGMPPEARVPVSSGGGVIDFMEALKRSVANASASDKQPAASRKQPAAAKSGAAKANRAPKPKKRIAGQGEMLLPISGKKPAATKEEKKPVATTRRRTG